MRTLFEIVEGAKDGNKPTHDECYYAMLALSALYHFDHMDLRNIREAAEGNKPSLVMRAKMCADGSFGRSKKAHATDPQQWLGKEVPENPDYQRMRAIAFKVAEKATGLNLREP